LTVYCTFDTRNQSMVKLLEENRAVMRGIISEDFMVFATKAFATLSSIERRGLPTQGMRFEGAELHYATEKLRWLVKVIILKELGFSIEEIMRLTARNKAFNDLKAV
jgi:hypothetical protein